MDTWRAVFAVGMRHEGSRTRYFCSRTPASSTRQVGCELGRAPTKRRPPQKGLSSLRIILSVSSVLVWPTWLLHTSRLAGVPVDSFQTWSGQMGSSLKCRDSPESTFMGTCEQHHIWQKCRGFADLLCKPCLSLPRLEAGELKTQRIAALPSYPRGMRDNEEASHDLSQGNRGVRRKPS